MKEYLEVKGRFIEGIQYTGSNEADVLEFITETHGRKLRQIKENTLRVEIGDDEYYLEPSDWLVNDPFFGWNIIQNHLIDELFMREHKNND